VTQPANDSFTHKPRSCALLTAQTPQKHAVYMVQVLTLQQEMDLLQIATYRTLQADRLQHLPLYTYWDFGSVAYSWLFLTAYYNSGTSIPSEQGDDQYNCLLWARHKEPNSPIPITGILKLCKMCY